MLRVLHCTYTHIYTIRSMYIYTHICTTSIHIYTCTCMYIHMYIRRFAPIHGCHKFSSIGPKRGRHAPRCWALYCPVLKTLWEFIVRILILLWFILCGDFECCSGAWFCVGVNCLCVLWSIACVFWNQSLSTDAFARFQKFDRDKVAVARNTPDCASKERLSSPDSWSQFFKKCSLSLEKSWWRTGLIQ